MTENHQSEQTITKYGGLDNKEIVMMFYKMKAFVDNLDENLDKCKLRKEVDTPMGKGVAYIDIPQSHVDKFRSSEYYTVLRSMLRKLEPVVEVIEDCDEACKLFANELR
jgi:hypothetical protein